MIFSRTIFFLMGLLVVQTGIAQGGTTVEASVDKNRILIGEPIQLTIQGRFHRPAALSFVKIDSIAHFEFLDEPLTDTLSYNDETIIKTIYRITSFDSGHWVIPSFSILPGLKTDTIPIDVVFSDFDPKQKYHDIKDIIEVPPEKKKRWWWLVAGGALLLAVLLVYLLQKKKPVALHTTKVMIDPYEEAMKQLEQLQSDKPEVKKYHSKLTDIFRLYVFRKKGILSLQKTTADLVLQLRDLNFTKEQFDKLSQALRLSDFVKFAKYVPTADDDRNCFEEIKKSIITLEQSES